MGLREILYLCGEKFFRALKNISSDINNPTAVCLKSFGPADAVLSLKSNAATPGVDFDEKANVDSHDAVTGVASVAAFEAQASQRLGYLFPERQEWCVVTITCPAGVYSSSAICRAVEDCDAHVLNLNVTAGDGWESGAGPVIELRVSHTGVRSLERSLERYGYTVISAQASDMTMASNDTLSVRTRNLLHLLDI